MQENLEKKGLSSGAKWGIGCGIGCLVIIILVAIAGYVGFRFVMGMLDDMTREFNQLGFEHVVKAQTIEVQEDIHEKTLYMGQVVKIYGNCSTDLAIMAQMGEIHGYVGGKVYFRGQMLVIQPGAVITNGVDVMAQAVKNYGKIEGDITGKYQISK
jgi:hypothetical protein